MFINKSVMGLRMKNFKVMVDTPMHTMIKKFSAKNI